MKNWSGCEMSGSRSTLPPVGQTWREGASAVPLLCELIIFNALGLEFYHSTKNISLLFSNCFTERRPPTLFSYHPVRNVHHDPSHLCRRRAARRCRRRSVTWRYGRSPGRTSRRSSGKRLPAPETWVALCMRTLQLYRLRGQNSSFCGVKCLSFFFNAWLYL